MNSFLIYQLFLGALAVVCGAFAVSLAMLTSERLPKCEALPRARLAGAFLTLGALLWCVPHTRPIAFDWMQPLLLPLAVALPVCGYFLVDFLFARGMAGLMILTGYFLVHGAFEFHSVPGLPLTLFGWSWAVVGILISAKPCWMRDWMRAAAARSTVRYVLCAYCAVGALLLAAALILHGTGRAG